MTIRDTFFRVSRPISVRLDDDALVALTRLQAVGHSQSEAIRLALISESRRLADRELLREEYRRVDADEADRAEMAAVAELMEDLRAPR